MIVDKLIFAYLLAVLLLYSVALTIRELIK